MKTTTTKNVVFLQKLWNIPFYACTTIAVCSSIVVLSLSPHTNVGLAMAMFGPWIVATLVLISTQLIPQVGHLEKLRQAINKRNKYRWDRLAIKKFLDDEPDRAQLEKTLKKLIRHEKRWVTW